MSDRKDKFLDTRRAADFLGLSPRTLQTYRSTGAGPDFHRFGGVVRYRRSDLDAWATVRRTQKFPEADLPPPA